MNLLISLTIFMCSISQSIINETISLVSPESEKGVTQVAKLWQESDGDAEAFKTFCIENYIKDPVEKKAVFLKISNYLEGIYGYFNRMTLILQKNTIINNGPLHSVDQWFASYSPSAHLSEDLYNNKLAFYIVLNFPTLSLKEKEALGNNRLAWAYSRMGDIFTSRIPSEVLQNRSMVSNDADMYTADYNIYMGSVLNKKGVKKFPAEMVLLSHWNLRDEIKSNYDGTKDGLDKQRSVYEVMKRIISQEIPVEAINSGNYDWDPFSNKLYSNGKEITGTPEFDVRYQMMINNYHSLKEIDKYTGDTYIDRKFDKEMEISLESAEALFDGFLSSGELKSVGKMISKRLGRKLEAYDIWYDGFKARSNIDERALDKITKEKYPDAEALEKDIPNILKKLGFTDERAGYIGEKIAVDPARGSGHAWGAEMKGQQSRLRTRIPADGMDYKGYNIAIHELGHNVEQTISMYDVDYYMMAGVPNTAFTEALAFVFQKRDLDLLGMNNNDPEKEKFNILDKIWSLYEIAGVSMLDISLWKWLYANPEASAIQLKEQTIKSAKEIWNKYYAPVFGVKDETVLAIYSHMIGYPLYLSAYAFGQIIEFQLERHFQGKEFAPEVERIFRLGRLTPEMWMKEATGTPLNTEPMLKALKTLQLK